MSKRIKIIICFLIILIVLLVSTIIYLVMNDHSLETINPNNTSQNDIDEVISNLPKENNDTVLTTNADTKIRVINEYDSAFFTKDKNLLIMFGSWCPNCKEEISEIEKILNYYRDDKNVNVIVIAHEYEDTVKDLVQLVENDVNFGNIEVLLDLKRIIRKTIDPEASTIPISYVVDKNGKILKKHSESITLEIAKDIVKE